MLSACGSLRLTSIFCFIFLNGLDVLTTFLGTRQGFSEGNYLLSAVRSSMGDEGMYFLKMLVVWIVVAYVLVLGARYQRLWYALHTINAVLAIVVISNLATILIG